MEFKQIKPDASLQPYIHTFWELKATNDDPQTDRIFPDGCGGLVINIGDSCKTDNGEVTMQPGKTYAVGAMTVFKDNVIQSGTHLIGVCLKPAAFSNFFKYASQHELVNQTVELEKSRSVATDQLREHYTDYLNKFFIDRLLHKKSSLKPILDYIHEYDGQVTISELADRKFMTVKQLQRSFKTEVGITPKEYCNVIRFQNALEKIKKSPDRSMLDIAYECGFYDHAHLSNEIKRNTGMSPSQF